MRPRPLGRSGPVLVLLTLLFSLSFLTPLTFADEGAAQAMPLDSAADFVRIANNAYPGIATPVRETTSPNAGTGAPSGQSHDPEPLPMEEVMTWSDYFAAHEALMDEDLEQTGYAEWRQKVDDLNERWLRSEERRAHGFNRRSLVDHKPIDTRALQIEKNLISLENQEVQP